VKFLRNLLDKQEKHFEAGGKLEKLYPLYEAIDTFLYTSGSVTKHASHTRDALDLKRMMMMVVYALLPTVIMALYNTGLQANLIIAGQSSIPDTNWQQSVLAWLGVGFDPNNIFENFVHGTLYFLPVYIVTMSVGGFWEVLFAVVRKHEVNEGFLVSGLLFPLILPPDIPYWQVAIGITFGVVIAKEVFGGVGMNILNVALTARAFLFFAYPAEISGDKVWVAVDGISKATPLAQLADVNIAEPTVSWMQAFLGFIPGSMGETSTLACLIGAAILLISRIGSWRIMLGVTVGMVLMSLTLNAIGSETNPMFNVPPIWHFVLGSFAFATVYMATDPVTASYTTAGQLVYGFFIGIFGILVRAVNPAFPEGWMLAILFMNVFASIIDRFFINRNIKRRLARNVI
jgi:Na+-transporting NADH:ubiquinone oxidoreductase subunit B